MSSSIATKKFTAVIETPLALTNGNTKMEVSVKNADSVHDITTYGGSVKAITCDNITRYDLQELSMVCTNLKGLKITGLASDVSNLAAIAKFKDLEKFTLTGSNVSDITALDTCRNLKSVTINNSDVRDIAPIVNLTKLEELDFTGNKITNVTPLSELGKNQFKANMMQSSDTIEKLTRDMMSALMQLANFKTEHERIQAGEIAQPDEAEMAKLITFNGQQTKFFEMFGIRSVIGLEMVIENADKTIRHFAKLLKKKFIDDKIKSIVTNLLYSKQPQTTVAAAVIRGAILTGGNPCKEYLEHRAERIGLYYGYITRKEHNRRKTADDTTYVGLSEDGFIVVEKMQERFYDAEFKIENIDEFVRSNGSGALNEFETNYNHPEAVKMAKAGDVAGLKRYFIVEYPSILSIALKMDTYFAEKYNAATTEYLLSSQATTRDGNTSTEIPVEVSKQICEKFNCRILNIFATSITEFVNKFETYDDIRIINKLADEYVSKATSHLSSAIAKDKDILFALTQMFKYPLTQARQSELYGQYATYDRLHIDLPQSFVLEEIVKSVSSVTTTDKSKEPAPAASTALVKMNFLTNLKLSDNKLAAAKIEHFHNLKDFNIEGNRLESENFECYGLHNLAKFNCSKNSLTNLEKSFASTSTAQSWGGLMQVVPQFRVAMYVSTLYNFTQQLARSGNLATTFDAITQQ